MVLKFHVFWFGYFKIQSIAKLGLELIPRDEAMMLNDEQSSSSSSSYKSKSTTTTKQQSVDRGVFGNTSQFAFQSDVVLLSVPVGTDKQKHLFGLYIF